MSYTLEVHKTAQRAFDRLPSDAQARVTARINALMDEPRPAGAVRLRGPLRGLYRLRVGDYRVADGVDDQAMRVRVRAIGHRRDFYDDLSRMAPPQ